MPIQIRRAVLFITIVSAAVPMMGQKDLSTANTPDPQALLARARQVLGFDRAAQAIVHYHAAAAAEQNYQSDRTYPPFFSAMQAREGWFDPQSGVERVSTQITFPGSGTLPAQTTASDASRAFALAPAKEQFVPQSLAALRSRYLNPWAVISDWTAAQEQNKAVRVAGREIYRDYPRVVLVHALPEGEQRLYLDAKSGFPVKLEFEEKHYLWGQQHVEYLYTNWTLAGGVMIPGSCFRLTDGKTEISETMGDAELLARDKAPTLTLPAEPARSADSLPVFLQPLDLTTTQVGPQTWLLSNRGYTEAVTKIGDEVFLLDATQGDERGRKDAEAIGKLFPGQHKITVVVTDLAWPHVAGVRYWVAHGATIVAHKAARDFLNTVVDRRWSLAPDALEQHRKTAKLNFAGVDSAHPMAGGALSLYPIDGIGSEVALMAYLAPDHFLWASDYIQTVSEASSYACEVWSAAQREGLHPEKTAAEHLPLTPWTKITELAGPSQSGGCPGAAQQRPLSR